MGPFHHIQRRGYRQAPEGQRADGRRAREARLTEWSAGRSVERRADPDMHRPQAERGDRYLDPRPDLTALPRALQRLWRRQRMASSMLLRAAGMSDLEHEVLRRRGARSSPWTAVMVAGDHDDPDPDADGTMVAPIPDPAEWGSDDPGAVGPTKGGGGRDGIATSHDPDLVLAERAAGGDLPMFGLTRSFLALADLHGERLTTAAQAWAEHYVPHATELNREILAHDFEPLLTHYRTYAASWPRYREPLTATLDAVLHRAQAITLAHGRNAAEYFIQELLPTHVSLVGVSNDLLLLQAGLRTRYGRDASLLRHVYDEVHRADPERIDAVLELADLMDQQHQILDLDAYPTELTVARAVERVVHRRTLRRLPQLMDTFPWVDGRRQIADLRHEVSRLLDHIAHYRIHGAVELLETYRGNRWLNWGQRRRMQGLADRFLRETDTEATRRVYLGRYREAAEAGRSREATEIWRNFQAAQAASAVRASATVVVADPTPVRDLPYLPSAPKDKLSRNERGRITRPQIRDALQELADVIAPGVRVELQDAGFFFHPGGGPVDGFAPITSQMEADLGNRHVRLRLHVPAEVSTAQVTTVLRALRDHLYGRLPMELPVYHYFRSVDVIMPDAAAANAIQAAIAPTVAEAGLGTVRLMVPNADEPMAVHASLQAPVYRIALPIPVGSASHEQRGFLAQALRSHVEAVARARVLDTGFETIPAPQIRIQLDLQVPAGTAMALAQTAALELLQPLAQGAHTSVSSVAVLLTGMVGSMGAGGLVAGGLSLLGASVDVQLGVFAATTMGGMILSAAAESVFFRRHGFVFVDELRVSMNGEPVFQVRDDRDYNYTYYEETGRPRRVYYADSPLGRALATDLRWRQPIAVAPSAASPALPASTVREDDGDEQP